jgi:hypothetical protein
LIECAVKLSATQRPDRFFEFYPAATNCRLFGGDALEHHRNLVPLDGRRALFLSHLGSVAMLTRPLATFPRTLAQAKLA